MLEIVHSCKALKKKIKSQWGWNLVNYREAEGGRGECGYKGAWVKSNLFEFLWEVE